MKTTNPAKLTRVYRGFRIVKSGDNFTVPALEGNHLAASVETAKKWIDAVCNEMAARKAREQAAKPAARSNSWGTCHFVNRGAAIAYYRPYDGEDAGETVSRKIDAGEIHIGPPTLKPGQTLSIHREERRYFITETAAQS